jgi:hypothetical protein
VTVLKGNNNAGEKSFVNVLAALSRCEVVGKGLLEFETVSDD